MPDIRVYRLGDIPADRIVLSIQRLYTILGMDKNIKLFITAAQLRQVQKTNPQLFDEKNFRILGFIIDLINERPQP
jgi:cytochrome c-type biogenesis protein CcmE